MSALNPLHVPKPFVSEVDERRHKKPVLESQLDLLREGTFSDVAFIVGPSKERIPCHQLFLKSRSPVFQVMFSEHCNHHKEIPLEDVDPKIFTKFLEFIYADNFEATVPEALELLQVAHMYEVQLLVDKCEKLLESEVTLTYAIDVFQAARKYGKIQLMEKLGGMMSKSLSKLQRLPSFSRLDQKTLTFILKRTDLEMKEVDLFRLAVKWAKNQSGRSAHECLEDILPHIRFPVMSLEEFTLTVVPTGLLPQPKVIKLFSYFGSDAEAKKSLGRTLEFNTFRRNSSVSVPIYAGGYEKKVVKPQKFRKLRDDLEFCMQPLYGEVLPESYYLGCDDEDPTVGLSGISVYCPAWQGRIWGGASTKFKIILRAKIRFDGKYIPFQEFYGRRWGYPDLLTMSPVEVEEGKVTEIKFDTVVPLRCRILYSITVEEIISYRSSIMEGHFYSYRAKDFGDHDLNIDVEIGNKFQAVLNTHRWLGEQTGHLCDMFPQLICKLSFKEL